MSSTDNTLSEYDGTTFKAFIKTNLALADASGYTGPETGNYQYLDEAALNKVNQFNNPNNDPTIANLIKQSGKLITQLVGSEPTTVDYSNFTISSLTAQEMNCDVSFNCILRDQLLIDPVNTYQSIFDSFSTFKQIFLLDLVASFGYPTPWFFTSLDIMEASGSTVNYACRFHQFSTDAKVLPVISIVNVCTGNEDFRVMNTSGQDSGSNPSYLRNIKRVSNGVVEAGAANLTFKEMLEISTAIPTSVVGYDNFIVWDYLIATIFYQNPNDPTVAGTLACAVNSQFRPWFDADPFVDGMNGNITFGGPRLIAVDKYTPDSNYLFGWSFLPFNNFTYDVYDTFNSGYVSPSPFTQENFTTILKLIGGIWLCYELITVFFKGKLKHVQIEFS